MDTLLVLTYRRNVFTCSLTNDSWVMLFSGLNFYLGISHNILLIKRMKQTSTKACWDQEDRNWMVLCWQGKGSEAGTKKLQECCHWVRLRSEVETLCSTIESHWWNRIHGERVCGCGGNRAPLWTSITANIL